MLIFSTGNGNILLISIKSHRTVPNFKPPSATAISHTIPFSYDQQSLLAICKEITMYRHLLRENLEEFIVSWPGAPEEEEQFRNWIEGRDEPLSLQNVLEWMEDNISVFRYQTEENSYVKCVMDNFARNFQKVILPYLANCASNLLSVIGNFSHRHHQTTWLRISPGQDASMALLPRYRNI